jgi:hypothetical protein
MKNAPINDLTQIALERLELDRANPRLSLDQREAKLPQKQLLKLMLEEFGLDELAESFIYNGFFKHEPIVVTKPTNGASFIVIEGNRRIAALKLLVNGPAHFDLTSTSFDDLHKQFLKLSSSARSALDNPWAAVVESRMSVAGYMGFRHVTGIKQWAALEKAAYVASLVDDGMRPDEIARVIGSKTAYVLRHYQAYRMIMQAREDDLVDTSAIEGQFGVFMRALQAGGVRDFIKVASPTTSPGKRPLRPASHKPFAEFVIWAFGTRDTAPLFSDSRRLTDFARILKSEKALGYIRSMPQPDFEKAHFLAGGEQEAAVSSVQVAEYALRDTVPYARKMKGTASFRDSIDRCADYLSQILVYFPEVQQKFFTAADT